MKVKIKVCIAGLIIIIICCGIYKFMNKRYVIAVAHSRRIFITKTQEDEIIDCVEDIIPYVLPVGHMGFTRGEIEKTGVYILIKKSFSSYIEDFSIEVDIKKIEISLEDGLLIIHDVDGYQDVFGLPANTQKRLIELLGL